MDKMWVIPSIEDDNKNTSKEIDASVSKKKEKVKTSITIIGDGKVRNVCLDDFNKNEITFGRADDNDIVISSVLVSLHHGKFYLDDDKISIVDNRSKNGFYINNLKCNDFVQLKDGDSIKIDNIDNPLNFGVLMVVSVGNVKNKWKEFDLSSKEMITIGRGNECNIVLNHISISNKHARIVKRDDDYFISSFDYKSGIILNNATLIRETLLKNKDIIQISNMKLIYSNGKILYQTSDYGIRLDAIDIVKTVKVKGKKRDISQHIDFTAASGEFISFVGGSGAGKSTFMKCISGINKPTSGQVLINGNDLFSNYAVLKGLIGYVPQDNIIFDDLTLIDMLKYASNLRMPEDSSFTEKKARIEEVLNIVELSDKKNVMIRNLSGGQQKRACIAVELLADPKLFFLDEPTSGLDPGTERSIMKTLRKMADSGKTIILVTHNTLNLHLCDRVVFFGYGGKLCFDGKPKDALEFFGVDDFVDIYVELNKNVDAWRDKFNKSEYKQTIKVEVKESEPKIKIGSRSFFKQLITLSARKFKTLYNNRQQLLMIFGQAPIIALLMSLIVTNDLFYSYDETKTILFGLAMASIWVGLLNSLLEICKERVILEKEYMADLRLSAYISSKVVYLLVISFFQAIFLIGTFVLVVDVPEMGLKFNWFIESSFISFMTIFSASAMGLFVSAFFKDTSTSMTVPAILSIPQMLLSGTLLPLTGNIKFISNFILCRWVIEAFGTINDLNSLVSSIQMVIPGYVREAENFYTFTVEHLTYDMTIIILMAVILFLASYFVLKYQLRRGK